MIFFSTWGFGDRRQAGGYRLPATGNALHRAAPFRPDRRRRRRRCGRRRRRRRCRHRRRAPRVSLSRDISSLYDVH